MECSESLLERSYYPGLHSSYPSITNRISFGKGENFWSNVFPSSLTQKFAKDIAKFGKVLKTIKRLEVLFVFIPVHTMLSMFRFDKEFGDRMVYPLVALFFGPYDFDKIFAQALTDNGFHRNGKSDPVRLQCYPRAGVHGSEHETIRVRSQVAVGQRSDDVRFPKGLIPSYRFQLLNN